jgi:hypothetical protein
LFSVLLRGQLATCRSLWPSFSGHACRTLFALLDSILYISRVGVSALVGSDESQRRDVLGKPHLARRRTMKKLLAALFAALFATTTVGITMLPTVAKAADMDKKDSKKKDKKDEMKK